MLETQVKIRNIQFCVDTSQDSYGSQFWKSLEAEKWEPDVLSWLFQEVDARTLFIDIGAANGSFTLVAGALGASVKSFEPHPMVFSILKRNVSLNPKMEKRIQCYCAAIGTHKTNVAFRRNSSPFLTRMTVLDSETNDSTDVVSLTDLLSQTQEEKVLIKIDIEGAEFPLLSDRKASKFKKK